MASSTPPSNKLLSSLLVKNHISNFQKNYVEHPTGDMFQPSSDTTQSILELFELLKDEFGGDLDDINISNIPNVVWREELFQFHNGVNALLSLEELLDGFYKLGCNFIPRSGDIQSRANNFLLLTIKHAIGQLTASSGVVSAAVDVGGVSAAELDTALKEFTLFPLFPKDISCLPPLPGITNYGSKMNVSQGVDEHHILPPCVPSLLHSHSTGHSDTNTVPQSYFCLSTSCRAAASVLFESLCHRGAVGSHGTGHSSSSSSSNNIAAKASLVLRKADIVADTTCNEIVHLMFTSEETHLSADTFLQRLCCLAEHFIQQDRLCIHFVNNYVSRKVATAKIALQVGSGKGMASVEGDAINPFSLSAMPLGFSSVCEPGSWRLYRDTRGVAARVRVEEFVPSINKYNIVYEGVLFQVDASTLTDHHYYEGTGVGVSGGSDTATPAGNSPTFVIQQNKQQQLLLQNRFPYNDNLTSHLPIALPTTASLNNNELQVSETTTSALSPAQQRLFYHSAQQLLKYQQDQAKTSSTDSTAVTAATSDGLGPMELNFDGSARGHTNNMSSSNNNHHPFHAADAEEIIMYAPRRSRQILDAESKLLSELSGDYTGDVSLQSFIDPIYVGAWWVRLLNVYFHFLAHDYGQTFVELERETSRAGDWIGGRLDGTDASFATDPVTGMVLCYADCNDEDVVCMKATPAPSPAAPAALCGGDGVEIEESAEAVAAAAAAVKYLGNPHHYCLGPRFIEDNKRHLIARCSDALEYGRCFFLVMGVAVGIHPFKLQSYFRMKAEEILREDSSYVFDPNYAAGPEGMRAKVMSAVTPGEFVDMGILNIIWHPHFDSYRFVFLTFSNEGGGASKEFSFANVSVFEKDNKPGKISCYFKLQLGHFIYFQPELDEMGGHFEFEEFITHLKNANRGSVTPIYYEMFLVGQHLYTGRNPTTPSLATGLLPPTTPAAPAAVDAASSLLVIQKQQQQASSSHPQLTTASPSSSSSSSSSPTNSLRDDRLDEEDEDSEKEDYAFAKKAARKATADDAKRHTK